MSLSIPIAQFWVFFGPIHCSFHGLIQLSSFSILTIHSLMIWSIIILIIVGAIEGQHSAFPKSGRWFMKGLSATLTRWVWPDYQIGPAPCPFHLLPSSLCTEVANLSCRVLSKSNLHPIFHHLSEQAVFYDSNAVVLVWDGKWPNAIWSTVTQALDEQ